MSGIKTSSSRYQHIATLHCSHLPKAASLPCPNTAVSAHYIAPLPDSHLSEQTGGEVSQVTGQIKQVPLDCNACICIYSSFTV